MPSKADELKYQRAQQKKRQLIITISILVIGALIILGIVFYPSIAPVGKISTPVAFARPSVKDNGMGDPNAPVKVEELADFQCPACASFSLPTPPESTSIEQRFIETYVKTGKVYFTYRPFSFIGYESKAAAQAAYCAMDQGKFWEYHDILYANQTGENVGDFSDKRLQAFAATLNLDMTQFSQCVQTSKYEQKINDNIVYGRSKGVTGTPSFLVNDKLVMLESLVQTVELTLAGK